MKAYTVGLDEACPGFTANYDNRGGDGLSRRRGGHEEKGPMPLKRVLRAAYADTMDISAAPGG